MGYARPTPKALSAEATANPEHAGLSQPQLAKALGVKAYNDLSKFELGKNEPSLMTLLAYSRFAGVRVEDLIDDDLTLQF
jgi:transcriptional regulator with XRE-family HTH domain